MSDTALVALAAAVPPTISALAALIVILRQRQTARETREEVARVHVLVNSQMTALKADLAIANARVAALLARVEELTRG